MARAGRKRKWPDQRSVLNRRDFGTRELQIKRLQVLGGQVEKSTWDPVREHITTSQNLPDATLAATALTVLYARKDLTKAQFHAAETLQKLNWKLFHKPFAKTHILGTTSGHGSSASDDDEDAQHRMQRARRRYETAITAVGQLGTETELSFRRIVFEDNLPGGSNPEHEASEISHLKQGLNAVLKVFSGFRK